MINTTYPAWQTLFKQLLFFFVILLFGLSAGLISSSGNVVFAAALGGIFIAGGLISQPVALLWLTSFFVLVVAGSIKYFLGFDRIWWIAYGMAMLLFLPAAMAIFNKKDEKSLRNVVDMRFSLIVLLLVAVISSSIAKSPLPQIIVATKSFILFGGVWATLSSYDFQKSTIKKFLLFFFGISLFQIIPVLYQYIFVRTSRQESGLGTVAAADSVVGTFGGSMEAGGLTAVLAIYILLSIVAIIAMYRHGAVSKRQFRVVLPFLLIPLALVEVKALFIFFPIAAAVLYKDLIFKSPAKALLGSLAGILILFLFLLIYQTFHWASAGTSFMDSLVHSFSYSFKDEVGYFSAQQGVVTRKFAYVLWFENHGLSNLHQLLLGHGFGASRTQGAVLGTAAIVFHPMNIDRVGWVMFLWDFGLVGFVAMLSLFFIAFINAGRGAKDQNLLNWERGLAAALQAFLPVIFLSMMYRNDVPYAAPMMFIVMATFGLISWLNRQRGIAQRD